MSLTVFPYTLQAKWMATRLMMSQLNSILNTTTLMSLASQSSTNSDRKDTRLSTIRDKNSKSHDSSMLCFFFSFFLSYILVSGFKLDSLCFQKIYVTEHPSLKVNKAEGLSSSQSDVITNRRFENNRGVIIAICRPGVSVTVYEISDSPSKWAFSFRYFYSHLIFVKTNTFQIFYFYYQIESVTCDIGILNIVGWLFYICLRLSTNIH